MTMSVRWLVGQLDTHCFFGIYGRILQYCIHIYCSCQNTWFALLTIAPACPLVTWVAIDSVLFHLTDGELETEDIENPYKSHLGRSGHHRGCRQNSRSENKIAGQPLRSLLGPPTSSISFYYSPSSQSLLWKVSVADWNKLKGTWL